MSAELKDLTLNEKIRHIITETKKSYNADEMLQELRNRKLVNDWVDVLGVHDELKQIYS